MTDYRAILAGRSTVILYRQAERNVCPWCGGSSWEVGRITAECTRCHFAIPLVSPVAPSTTITAKG